MPAFVAMGFAALYPSYAVLPEVCTFFAVL
jgi:hypothetical protein